MRWSTVILSSIVWIASSRVIAQGNVAPPAPAPTPPQTSVTDLQRELETTKRQLQSITDQVATTERTYATAAGDASTRLKALEQRNADIDKKEKEALSKKYIFGQTAYTQIAQSVTIITFIHDLLLAEVRLNDITNVWSDSDFRNAADQTREWGTVLGLGVAVVGSLLKSEAGDAAKFGTIGAGASVAAISQIVGSVFGAQKGDALKKKIALIDVSRAAFDDLVIREKLLEGFINANKSFLTKVDKARGQYNAAASDEQKSAGLAELESLIPEFRRVLEQIPEYVTGAKSAADRYADRLKATDSSSTAVGDLRKQIEDVAKNFQRIQTTYEQTVKPILDLSAEVIVVIRVGVSATASSGNR